MLARLAFVILLVAMLSPQARSEPLPCWSLEHQGKILTVQEGETCPPGWRPDRSTKEQIEANRAFEENRRAQESQSQESEARFQRFRERAMGGVALGAVFGLASSLWLALRAFHRHRKTKQKRLADRRQHLWAEALEEVNNGTIDKATWAEAFSQAGGNEPAARARYLEIRVKRWEALS